MIYYNNNPPVALFQHIQRAQMESAQALFREASSQSLLDSRPESMINTVVDTSPNANGHRPLSGNSRSATVLLDPMIMTSISPPQSRLVIKFCCLHIHVIHDHYLIIIFYYMQ